MIALCLPSFPPLSYPYPLLLPFFLPSRLHLLPHLLYHASSPKTGRSRDSTGRKGREGERRTPHDVTTRETEDEGAAPDGLVVALGSEEVGEDGKDDDEDEADDEGGAVWRERGCVS